MTMSMIDIEVVAGTPERQVLIPLRVADGTTVAEAVEQSGVAERLPEIEIDPQRLGVFGKRKRPDHVLSDGDRVEVYRPLTADPKEIRRRMAELERARGRRK